MGETRLSWGASSPLARRKQQFNSRLQQSQIVQRTQLVSVVFAMWSLKVSWSSKVTPRFQTEVDGVIVEEPSWMEKSYCRVGVAGKTRSSVFARLSCRLYSFHPCRDVRQAA